MTAPVKKSAGPWTVWDTGFAYIVAPVNLDALHPHINVAVQQGAQRRYSTANANGKEINRLFRKAWAYANEMNARAAQ